MDEEPKPEPMWSLARLGKNLRIFRAVTRFRNDTTIDLGTLNLHVPQEDAADSRPLSDQEKYRITAAAMLIFPLILTSPNILLTTILAQKDEKEKYMEVKEIYDIFYGLFAFFGGILIILVGYRYVALAGAVMAAVGNLIAAASPVNIHVMSFSLGFLQGMGNIFLLTSVTVAVLEYFGKKSLQVLMKATVVYYIYATIYSIMDLVLGQTNAKPSWRAAHYYQFAAYLVFGLAGGACLIPLNLHMDDAPEETFVSRAMNIKSLSLDLGKSPIFYALIGVFFGTGLGASLPETYVDKAYDRDKLSFVIPGALFLLVGSLGVTIASSCCKRCCCPCCHAGTALRLISALGFVMGALSWTVGGFQSAYVFVYAFLYGVASGSRAPLMKYVVPRVIGAQDIKHLGLAVGLTEFAAGIGAVIGEHLAEAVAGKKPEPDDVIFIFYFSGLMLMVSSGCAVVLHLKTERGKSADNTGSSGEIEDKAVQDGIEVNNTESIATLSTGDCGTLSEGLTEIQRPDYFLY